MNAQLFIHVSVACHLMCILNVSNKPAVKLEMLHKQQVMYLVWYIESDPGSCLMERTYSRKRKPELKDNKM